MAAPPFAVFEGWGAHHSGGHPFALLHFGSLWSQVTSKPRSEPGILAPGFGRIPSPTPSVPGRHRISLRAIDCEPMPIRILRFARDLIHRKPESPQNVTSGRIEIERDGKVAYLEYTLAGNVLELIHTEVPKDLQHMGLASALAERALNWAREKGYKVDVICPFVHEYISKHPEYADLIMT